MSYQQEKFKEIADAIREKTGTVDLIKPSEFADKIEDVYNAGQNAGSGGYDEGFEDGKIAESRDKWDKQMSLPGFIYRFAGSCWNNETFTPYTDIVTGTANIIGLFTYSGVTDLKGILDNYGVSLDLTRSVNASNLFNSSKVTHIPKLSLDSCTTLTSGFQNCPALVSVDELSIPKVTNASNAFSGCTSLTEIRISGEIKASIDLHWSPLSQASVESVVAALSGDVTGQTITLNDAQMESLNHGTSWWDDLVASKDNWHFALLNV